MELLGYKMVNNELMATVKSDADIYLGIHLILKRLSMKFWKY